MSEVQEFVVGTILTTHVEGIGSGGEGIGRHLGYTLFIEGALPGETVQARLSECHKNYGRAELISIIKPSVHRVQAPCPIFDRCGGCQLMHLSYTEQLVIKRQRIIDAIERIAKCPNITVEPCIPSPSQLAYRNKIQLPAQNGKKGIVLGLYERSSHNLVEVDHCLIHCTLGDELYRTAHELIRESGITAYDPSTDQGELRHLLIKTAIHTEETLAIFITKGKPSSLLRQLAKLMMKRCPTLKGVVHNNNPHKGNVILGQEFILLEGSGSIYEEINGLQFKISPASFFQVNPLQAAQLYLKALEIAVPSAEEILLDAYCGVGTLALHFAPHVKRVFGIECVQEAIRDAEENARLNGITNCSFLCGDVERTISRLSKIDIVILNPPRSGCCPSLLKALEHLSPKKIVYISCDPATLARDIALLNGYGYLTKSIQPFDMFPQTAHVECVAYIERK